MQWAFASSLFADRLQKERKQFATSKSMIIRCRIIPRSIISLYDNKADTSIQLHGFETWLDTVGMNYRVSQSVLMCQHQLVEDKVKLIQRVHANLVWQSTCTSEFLNDVVVLVGRQFCTKDGSNGNEKLWIFPCPDKGAWDKLDRDYIFGFDFEIGNAVKAAWCRFGEYQRIRFFPEYITTLIPRFFVCPDMSQMEYMMKIYDSDFKHQWRVSLDDPTFNLYYKAITGDDHISNNYHRERLSVDCHVIRTLGFWEYVRRRAIDTDFDYLYRWCIEQDMDSDAVFVDLIETDKNGKPLYIEENESNFVQWTQGADAFYSLKSAVMRWKKMECNPENGRKCVLRDCHHFEVAISHLSEFEKCRHKIDASTLGQFSLSKIIQSLDHIVSGHQLLRAEYRAEIHRFTTTQIECNEGAECPVLSQYRNRIRENTEENRSNRDGQDPRDPECVIVNEVMDSVHVLMMHRCLIESRGSNDRFGTEVMELEDTEKKEDETDKVGEEVAFHGKSMLFGGGKSKLAQMANWLTESYHRIKFDRTDMFSFQWIENKDTSSKSTLISSQSRAAPLGIDFGVSVLRWIPFGALPYFRSLRDEIVNNRDSTIDEELFERYLIECIQKMKGTIYSLKEMLALKLYTDTTVFTSFVRKAHWTTSPVSMKKMYYFWASTLYKAALYHSAPIPSVNGHSPQTLYHGLNRMFTMSAEQPKYHGPFSASTQRSVAHRYSNETGLFFRIIPSYSNPLQFCLGIDVETISCYKHEREILLVDQYIPIRSTKAFNNTSMTWVDLLMYTLKGRKSRIIDRDRFFLILGIQFDPKWKSLIKEHSELFELSAFGGRLVIARLYMELDIWSDDWVPLKVNKESADKDLLIYCVEQRGMKSLLPWYQVLTSQFEVFQNHNMDVCWKVQFKRRYMPFTAEFEKTEYRINDSHVGKGSSWYSEWPKNAVIHRIECSNRKLFGKRVVWTQVFDRSMDANPKDFVVPKHVRTAPKRKLIYSTNPFPGFSESCSSPLHARKF